MALRVKREGPELLKKSVGIGISLIEIFAQVLEIRIGEIVQALLELVELLEHLEGLAHLAHKVLDGVFQFYEFASLGS